MSGLTPPVVILARPQLGENIVAAARARGRVRGREVESRPRE